MNRKKAFIGILSVIMIMMMVATGCKPKHAAEPTPVQPKETTVVTPTETSLPQSETITNPSVPSPATPTGTQTDKVSLASADKDKGEDEQTPKPNAQTKLKIEIKSPYTQAKPTLLGLTLKTSAAEITEKFGKPKEQFVMEDDTDPITVYDYTDFLVGFDKQKQLHFVDVRSADVNPGLNGLKLGDPVEEVTKALGKPSSNTSFVLTYKATGAVLKLDIDPKSQKVNSIKLFAE
ncbi:DUF4309 domain-containing protein [Paenibacillus sp. MZ04-78.2]|uniref:DUF4309 domain-containing protein n=1 Tax=Paenibacillus sp. MZ04-78.2 TaxID=2962034 RepID=UPI0020B6C418|nr:DUF4309 domain-containing protein [Paenibacillus sp. MZ04-78.2]